MSGHRYRTRATSVASVCSVPHGKPQLIPIKTTLKEKGTAASSSEAQDSFLKAVGMISPDISVDTVQDALNIPPLGVIVASLVQAVRLKD